MSYPIPEEIVEEVGRLCNIIDVVGDYISLEKKGKNFLGLCPFHQEKTPSFSVSEEKQLYYCFGCGAAGNVFGFVMKMEGLTFPDAVRLLARRAGVHIPSPDSRADRTKNMRDKLIAAHELAVRYYRYNLSSTSLGVKVAEYLEKRGITTNTGEFFKLGYAPRGWDGFLKVARKEGFTPEILVRAGLVSAREGGGYYDRFRDRLMFPIYNQWGRVVGFGGRVLPFGDQTGPKYLNTPETTVFNKSRLLYGFHLAKGHIRSAGSAIIVEGYTDVIAAHQAGFKNVVASLGTSLTEGQGKLLFSQAREILIGYDADTAGQSATWRGFNLLQDLGCGVKVIELPAGSDPDSFICREGADKFGRLIGLAKPVVEYRLNRLKAQHDLSTREGRLSYLGEALPVLASVISPAEKEIYVKPVAESLGIPETALRDELKRYCRRPGQRNRGGHNIILKDQTNNIDHIEIDPAERMLLALMLVDNRVIGLVREKLQLDDFGSKRLRQVIELIWKMDAGGKVVDGEGIINYFSDLQIQQLITRAVMDDSLANLPSGTAGRMAADCIDRIKNRQLSRRWVEFRSKLKMIKGQDLSGQARDVLREQWAGLVRNKDGPCRSGEGEDY